MNPRLLRGLAMRAGLLLLASCTAAPPPPTVLPAAAAPLVAAAPQPGLQITRMELGNAIDSDGHVLQPSVHFSPHDVLHASLDLESHSTAAHNVGIKWTHLDSRQTVLSESKSIAAAGRIVSQFQISKADGWPLGMYKAEASVDGVVVQTRLLEVR